MSKIKKLTQNVNKDSFLNDLPIVKPERSRWLSRETNYQPSRLGRIVPIYYEEVVPGSYKGLRMAMTSHTQTPNAPIFNAIYTEIRAFFVPFRLCADLLNGYKTRKSPWVKVFGEDNASESSKVIVPLEEQELPSFTNNHQFISDITDFYDTFEFDDNVFNSLDLNDPTNSHSFAVALNYLNLAAYELIYQRHYRNENYEAATDSALYRLLFDAYNEEKASVTLSSSFDYEIANREKDYFTGMKPFTQKGDPVTVGLVGEAPVYAQTGTNKKAIDVSISIADPTDVDEAVISLKEGSNTSSATIRDSENVVSHVGDGRVGGKLFADLKSVNGITIEELRMLIKTQELLEKDAIYGSKYALSLNAHFGCCPLDETLQDPAEIYKVTITSNMQAIFQTSATKDETSILGTIGANSTTQTDPFVIVPSGTKFKEHGILMICAVHKLQNVYDSRYYKPRMNFKKKRFDFYTPELNDLGYQSVEGGKEMILASGAAGFNEAFAENRYKFNKSHGSLNTDFPYWAPAISAEYASAAALYKEDTIILDKALSVRSDTAPQFFDAWGFEGLEDKPMSLHSIPGMDGVI